MMRLYDAIRSRSSVYDKQLKRGALVNLISLVSWLIHPLFFVIVTWLFGPELLGVYFLATFITDVANSTVTSGYNDAAMIFGSRHADSKDADDELYGVFANALLMSLGLSGLVLVAAHFGVGPLIERLYDSRENLAQGLMILVWTLPFMAISGTCIAATKARMHMEYAAAINGFASPLVLLGTSLIAWWVDGGLIGLMIAHLITRAVLAAMAVWGFTRVFESRKMLRAMRRFRVHRKMLTFAVSQSLNMTFNRYATRLDVVMLAAFGHSNVEVAFYASAALLTFNIRQIKFIFSNSLAPIVARYHSAGDRALFEETLGRVARWTTTLVVPAVLAAIVLRADILILVHSSYTDDSVFMVVLLATPFLSCAFGLAGNCIVYTAHTNWNLLNAVLIAGLNTGFNLLLIPPLGLLGAAIATAMSSLLYSVLQLVELWFLERVTIRLGAVFKAHLGWIVLVPVLVALWDPGVNGTLATRIAIAIGLVLAYAIALLLLRHPEARALLSRVVRRIAPKRPAQ